MAPPRLRHCGVKFNIGNTICVLRSVPNEKQRENLAEVIVKVYQRHPGYAELLFQPALAMKESTMRFYLDLLAISAHIQLMAISDGRIGAHDIHMSMPEPAHLKRYRELTPSRFHFGATQIGVRVVLDTALLDQPMAMTDLRTLAHAEARCKLLQEMSHNGKWSDWVAMMLFD